MKKRKVFERESSEYEEVFGKKNWFTTNKIIIILFPIFILFLIGIWGFLSNQKSNKLDSKQIIDSGTKAGTLNTFMKKGYLFNKTYKGKIIQFSFKTNVQSNEFDFSVTNRLVAQTLLNNVGKEVEVHYVEYFDSLSKGEMEKYIVDSIYKIRGDSGIDNGMNSK